MADDTFQNTEAEAALQGHPRAEGGPTSYFPGGTPDKAVNIDCASYCSQPTSDNQVQATDSPSGIVGFKSHSWYFGKKVFASDPFEFRIGTDLVLPGTRIEVIPSLTNRFVLQR